MKKALFSIVIICVIVTLVATSCSLKKKDKIESLAYDWSKVASVSDSIWSITACDPDHAWAASLKGGILFYDGLSWKQQGNIDGYVEGLSSTDANHVWAMGREGVTEKSFICFYDGSAWEKQYESEDYLNDIFALDPGHVWAGTSEGFIYFFDGKTWQNQYEAIHSVRDVFALDANNVWAAIGGSIGENGMVLFFNGESWEEQFISRYGSIIALSGLGPDRVWAIGFHDGADPVGLKSHIYFFDGSKWMVQDIIDEGLVGIFAFDDEHIWTGSSWGSIYQGTKNGP